MIALRNNALLLVAIGVPVLGSLLAGAPSPPADGQPPAQDSGAAQPVELGRVRFGRDLAAGLAAARDRRLPVLLLFQEVPG